MTLFCYLLMERPSYVKKARKSVQWLEMSFTSSKPSAKEFVQNCRDVSLCLKAVQSDWTELDWNNKTM